MKYLNYDFCEVKTQDINRRYKLAMFVCCFSLFEISYIYAQGTDNTTNLPDVTVTASPFEDRSALEMTQPITVLQGDNLRRKREVSLGDTLSNELGVTSSSFGPGAGRPIIRALDGPRIQILENGVGGLDVSSLSPDHAVTVETLNAAQIEILRGPAVLLYGGGAAGGVVNVVTNRIPNRLFSSPTGNFEIRGNTATEERTGAFNANSSIGQMSWSFGAFKRKTGDYSIPGRAEIHNPDSEKNVVRNSAVDSQGGSIGGSFVGERGFFGGSISGMESIYGIPGPDGASIDLKQVRYGLAGELDKPIIGLDKLKIRMGYNDYRHNELESDGEVSTRYTNRELDNRIEFIHTPIANWKGLFGMQLQDRNFSALGEEAIVPVTKSRSTGLFLLEEHNLDRLRLEFGGRFEHASRNPQNNVDPSRTFNLFSGSVGALWTLMDNYGLGFTVTRGQRAPAIEELYVNGAHHGTATFQIGNDALAKETSHNFDLSLRKTAGMIQWKVNAFYNRFNNYIFLSNLDVNGDGVADRVNEEGELDLGGEFQAQDITQTGATFYGAEAEVLFTLKPDSVDLRLFTDYVRGKLDKNGNVPRTTPLRFGLELNHRVGPWSTNLNTIHVLRQSQHAELETSTSGYTLMNFEASYRIKETKSNGIRLFLQGRNLLDEEIRIHTSFLKNFSPQPGRALVAGLRGDF